MNQNVRLPAIVDRRQIDFGVTAIHAAIETVGIGVLGLPAGVRVREISLDAKHTTLVIFLEGDTGARIVSHAHIAALLISYLIAIRVPIGRTAAKQIVVGATSITLNFITKVAKAPRPWDDGLNRTQPRLA